MDEAEWLACADPTVMLEFLNGHASVRKLRLVICACYHCSAGDLQTSPYRFKELVREAIELAERFEDDHASVEQGNEILEELRRASRISSHTETGTFSSVGYRVLSPNCSTGDATWALVCCCRIAGQNAAKSSFDPVHVAAEVAEPPHQAVLLRDILGNPFRPSSPLPPAMLAWNDRTIPRLAQAIYEDRKMPEGTFDIARLAILADGLLDAGCDDDDLIQHCREPGPHVRGCWAVDLCLGLS